MALGQNGFRSFPQMGNHKGQNYYLQQSGLNLPADLLQWLKPFRLCYLEKEHNLKKDWNPFYHTQSYAIYQFYITSLRNVPSGEERRVTAVFFRQPQYIALIWDFTTPPGERGGGWSVPNHTFNAHNTEPGHFYQVCIKIAIPLL